MALKYLKTTLSEKVMKSVKIKSCLIITLALAMVLTLGAFFGILISRADRAVSIGGANVFVVVGDAEIWAHRVENTDATQDSEPYYYTMFTFGNDADAVNYRRNLAYKWFYNSKDKDDYISDSPRKGPGGNWWVRDVNTGIVYDPSVTPTVNESGYWVIGDQVTSCKESADFVSPEKAEGYFRMEIGFEEVNFDKFVITFESQQYSMTKDEKTSNFIIFLPKDEGKVAAVVTSDKEVAESKAEDIEIPEDALSFNPDHIVIAFAESDMGNGNYAVKIFNAADEKTEDKIQNNNFENIGGTFVRNVSSGDKPVIPLSFKADMPEREEGDVVSRARMAVYELNGQSFLLNRDSDGYPNNFTPINEVDDGEGKKHYTGGQVNDTTPPVLCLGTNIRHIIEGSELSSYTAIDVLTQYTNTETGFFILTKDQAADENFNSEDYSDENLFHTVKSDDDRYIIPHANHYLPQENDYTNGGFGEDYVPCAAIKIYIKLTDTTSSGGQSTYVFLDWYVEDQYKLTINGNNYVAVSTDKAGAHYNRDYEGNYTAKDGEEYTGWEALIKEYQDKVDEAAEDLRAGTDDFYLPSFEKLILDNSTAYSDMTFSIYYMVNGTKSSATGKSASALSLDLNSAGNYMFTVYAQDAASNDMWYTKEVEGAEPETVKFAASEIWDIYEDEELRNTLPWFTFKAGISEITVEEPDEQETAYVGESYTADSFEIKGVSTKSVYKLYRFNSDLYAAEKGRVLSYDNFMEIKGELFDGEGRKYFTNIVASSELEEGSVEYEQFYNYNWNSSARSFVPQDGNAFYLIVCEVTSAQFPAMSPVKAYMGIAASVTPKPIKGEDTWVQDNMISIILLSIAGAAFIGIILLLVIKPKEKTDIDVQYEQEVAAKAEKPKSKRK